MLFTEYIHAHNMSHEHCSVQVEQIIVLFQQNWSTMDHDRRMRMINSIVAKRSEIHNEACLQDAMQQLKF